MEEVEEEEEEEEEKKGEVVEDEEKGAYYGVKRRLTTNRENKSDGISHAIIFVSPFLKSHYFLPSRFFFGRIFRLSTC